MKIFILALLVSGLAVVFTAFSKKKVESLPSVTPGQSITPSETNFASSSPSPTPTLVPKATVKPTPNGSVSNGWRLTVYYTPVEQYHSGEEEHVPGVGSMSKAFLEILRLEGVGKISKGPHTGKYLHYTPALGYWLTEEPLDAQGKTLIKMKTMAAPSNIKFGTQVKILDCGNISKPACGQISNLTWVVSDRFGDDPNEKHFDLYIGEEDRENFLKNHPLVFASDNAIVELK